MIPFQVTKTPTSRCAAEKRAMLNCHAAPLHAATQLLKPRKLNITWFEKEHHLPTSMTLGFKILIFQDFGKTHPNWYCIQISNELIKKNGAWCWSILKRYTNMTVRKMKLMLNFHELSALYMSEVTVASYSRNCCSRPVHHWNKLFPQHGRSLAFQLFTMGFLPKKHAKNRRFLKFSGVIGVS